MIFYILMKHPEKSIVSELLQQMPNLKDGSSGSSQNVTISSNSLPTSANAEVVTNEDTEFTFQLQIFHSQIQTEIL